MTDEVQRIIRGECRVNCQRSMIKRALWEMTRVTDTRPMLVIFASTLVFSLVLAAIVKSILVFTG